MSDELKRLHGVYIPYSGLFIATNFKNIVCYGTGRNFIEKVLFFIIGLPLILLGTAFAFLIALIISKGYILTDLDWNTTFMVISVVFIMIILVLYYKFRKMKFVKSVVINGTMFPIDKIPMK